MRILKSPQPKIHTIASALDVDADTIYDLIEKKIAPLREKIRAEFQATPEYATKQKHKQILEAHNKAKAKFAKTYACDETEYEYCYDVFGNLMNDTYLQKIISQYKQRRSYYRQQHSNYGNYNTGGSNWGGFGSYQVPTDSTYTDDEKTLLKKFYRTLSKEFHPDNATGDTEAMQLVNKLKGDWGV